MPTLSIAAIERVRFSSVISRQRRMRDAATVPFSATDPARECSRLDCRMKKDEPPIAVTSITLLSGCDTQAVDLRHCPAYTPWIPREPHVRRFQGGNYA